MRRFFTYIFCLFCTFFVLGGSCPVFAHASVLRNGSFSDGLDGWMVNSQLGDWNPLTSDLAASLDPPIDGFTGTVLYQNLNVSGIAGKNFQIYLWFRKVRAWSGRTLAVYVDFVDSNDNLQRLCVLRPENDAIPYQDWSVFTNTFSFPANASKLVKLSFAKEDYGSFDTDGIMLLADGVVPVGLVPQITSLSSDSGPYGSLLTINGFNFGTNASGEGKVLIDNSDEGIEILSWSGTQIVVRCEEPTRTGTVCVLVDGVESDGRLSYTVTSPTYTIDVLQPQLTVIRGENARFLVRLNSRNGFNAIGEVRMSVPQSPPGSVTFSPDILKGPGGVAMTIATSGLSPGTYEWRVQSEDDGGKVRSAPFVLKVVSVSDIEFYQRDDTGSRVLCTYLSISKQRRVYVYCCMITTDGERLPESTPIALSSNSSNLQVFSTAWGGYEIYAVNTTSAKLTATSPDGYSEYLPVVVTSPATIISTTINPVQVSNKGYQTITYNAASTTAIDVDCDYVLRELVDYTYSWSDGDKAFTATGRVPEGTMPGRYFFHAFLRSDHESERVRQITVLNDSGRGMIKGSVFAMRPLWSPDPLAFIQLYDDATGAKVYDYAINSWGDYTIPYIQPGVYRIRLLPMSGYEPQWYPNAYAFSAALPVTVNVGDVLSGISFFLVETDSLPPRVCSTDPVDAALDVAPGSLISATFSKPVDPATVNLSTFFLEDSQHNRVSGTVECDGLTATFKPDKDLQAGMTYTATITTGVTDNQGRPLTAHYSWHFSVGYVSLADLKELPDGTYVTLKGKVLYLVKESMGYIEEPNRACGIRIEGAISAAEDDIVNIAGTMRSSPGGERYIQIESISATGSMSLRPLGCTIRSLKQPLVDGLYVQVWGRVIPNSVTPNSYQINDGSDDAGVQIYTQTLPSEEYVVVRGAAAYDDAGRRVVYAK